MRIIFPVICSSSFFILQTAKLINLDEKQRVQKLNIHEKRCGTISKKPRTTFNGQYI